VSVKDSHRPLFRQAALDAQRTSVLGAIVLIQPISFVVLTAFFALIAGAVGALFAWGTYTQHATLTGQLIPDLGVIGVQAPQYGTIVVKQVAEGDTVRRGDVLYVVSSERFNSGLEATRASIGREVDVREQSLLGQIENTATLGQSEQDSLVRTIAALRSEAGNLAAMVTSQTGRVALAEGAAGRYERLRNEGFVAAEVYIAKYEDALEQRARLRSLQREHSAVHRQLVELESRSAGLPLEYQNRIAELERALALARQERSENEARRRLAVVAPEDGMATAAVGEVGQVVDASKTLVSIIPRGARLRAVLHAPSRAIGFVTVGASVLLRYTAFPYQKFGHHEGVVAAVSRTALAPAELTVSPGAPLFGAAEPVYRVTVDLQSQTIDAHGQPRLLQAGMTVEADVLLETRRLWEWVLEPLYTLSGRVH
jgi:membrane fusion protein